MSRIAPKPMISQTVRTWPVEPGMTFALVEDRDGKLWIEQSCPIGTHFWTVEQASDLVLGERTAPVLREAIALCAERRELDRLPTLMNVRDAELESALSPQAAHRPRFAAAIDSRLARA